MTRSLDQVSKIWNPSLAVLRAEASLLGVQPEPAFPSGDPSLVLAGTEWRVSYRLRHPIVTTESRKRPYYGVNTIW
jgi:hypothetical protein